MATSIRRNFFVLAGYQIIVRIGWIFKTESVIIPAVMDALCGPNRILAAWARSWLPQLNRFGQSIPQLLMANRIRNTAQKKRVVVFCSGVMGVVFIALSLVWYRTHGSPSTGMRVFFLIVYGIFFISVGINNLGFNTLQGKVIQVDRRGRLLLIANIIGGISAVTAAWILLRYWMSQTPENFVAIFAFSGICFLAGSFLVSFLTEKPDDPTRSNRKTSSGPSLFRSLLNVFARTYQLLRNHPDFRKLATIAACFGCSIMLLPHYQAYYRETVDMTNSRFPVQELITWVVVQNLGTIVFSLIAGPIADRFGNRMVLRCMLLGIAAAPPTAIFAAEYSQSHLSGFTTVFVLIGLTPVIIRILNNFALELADRSEHPQYLSALSLSIALPVLVLSQVVGWLIPIVGFPGVFLGVFAIILLGWTLTFFVEEPRNHLTGHYLGSDNI